MSEVEEQKADLLRGSSTLNDESGLSGNGERPFSSDEKCSVTFVSEPGKQPVSKCHAYVAFTLLSSSFPAL